VCVCVCGGGGGYVRKNQLQQRSKEVKKKTPHIKRTFAIEAFRSVVWSETHPQKKANHEKDC
jgi:hypothetical protein